MITAIYRLPNSNIDLFLAILKNYLSNTIKGLNK